MVHRYRACPRQRYPVPINIVVVYKRSFRCRSYRVSLVQLGVCNRRQLVSVRGRRSCRNRNRKPSEKASFDGLVLTSSMSLLAWYVLVFSVRGSFDGCLREGARVPSTDTFCWHKPSGKRPLFLSAVQIVIMLSLVLTPVKLTRKTMTTKIGDYGIDRPLLVDDDKIGVRTTTTRKGLVRDGCKHHISYSYCCALTPLVDAWACHNRDLFCVAILKGSRYDMLQCHAPGVHFFCPRHDKNTHDIWIPVSIRTVHILNR